MRAKDLVRPVDRPSAHFLPDEMCGASALSLYKDVSDVHLAQRLIPGFKNKKVAVGDLTPEMGVIKNTPTEFNGTPFKSHHDWWVPTDYTDVPPFAVVTL